MISCNTSPGWSFDNWTDLAKKMGLSEPKDFAITESKKYLSRFLDFYENNLQAFAPVGIYIDEVKNNLEAVVSQIETYKSFQIVGPSGCGKTLLSKHIAIKLISHGYVPIFISAKYFSGQFYDLLNRSIAPFYPETAINFLNILPSALKQPLLIIDGVNECPANHLSALKETLNAFLLRRNCIMLITSQIPLELPSEIVGPIAKMSYLSDEEKHTVLNTIFPQSPRTLIEFLPILKTPFEIYLASQVVSERGSIPSKYELFNAYVRKCLERGRDSSIAFRILVKFAHIMSERFCMAMMESEFKRITETSFENVHTKPDGLETIINSGLLKFEQGYISFYHELIHNFFEAEALLSRSSPELFMEISKPKNYHLSEFVLGSVSDIDSAKKLIRRDIFSVHLGSGMEGYFGDYVKAAISSEIIKTFRKTNELLRILDLSFNASANLPRLKIIPLMKFQLTKLDKNILTCAGKMFWKGYFVEDILQLINSNERVCRNIISNKGFKSSKDINIVYNALWYDSYVFCSNNSLPISYIFVGMQDIVFHNNIVDPEVISKMQVLIQNLTYQPIGNLFLLCEAIEMCPEYFVQDILEFLHKCWETNIYNLRVNALQAVSSVEKFILDESVRFSLINFMESKLTDNNIFLNTAIYDTLSLYKTLDTGISINIAIQEVWRVLDSTQNCFNWDKEYNGWSQIYQEMGMEEDFEKSVEDMKCKIAYNIYSKTFEEIYQDIYYDAIYGHLSKEELLSFLIMAAMGASDYSFWLDNILLQLVKIDNPKAIPAFQKWGMIPNKDIINPQESTNCYVLSLIGLSHHKDEPLRLKRPLRNDEAAWQIYGEIIFWLHKPGISQESLHEKCSPCWQRLYEGHLLAAVDPLMRIERAISNFKRTIPFLKHLFSEFPTQIKPVLEDSIKHISNLFSLFKEGPWSEKSRNQFIITMLEEVGDLTSIPILEPLLESPDLGRLAAETIRALNRRKT